MPSAPAETETEPETAAGKAEKQPGWNRFTHCRHCGQHGRV